MHVPISASLHSPRESALIIFMHISQVITVTLLILKYLIFSFFLICQMNDAYYPTKITEKWLSSVNIYFYLIFFRGFLMIIDTTYNSKTSTSINFLDAVYFLVFSSVCFIWGRLSFDLGQKFFITPTLFWKIGVSTRKSSLFPNTILMSTAQNRVHRSMWLSVPTTHDDFGTPSGPLRHFCSHLRWIFSSPASARSSFALWWMSLGFNFVVIWQTIHLWINTSKLMSVLTL